MTIRKIHSFQSLDNYNKHNVRELYVKNADLAKSKENAELINVSGETYKDLWYQRIKDVEIQYQKQVTIRKNAVRAIDIVTTFSKDADIDIEKWKEENIKWMKETFGEENVLSMQLHEDEVTPHIHTIVIPINDKGKLCARDFTGGRKKMFDLQASYGKAMEPLGLRRGEMYSRTRKEDLNHFYSVLNKAIDKKAPERLPEESVDDYLNRVNQYVSDLHVDMVGRERQLTRSYEREVGRRHQFQAKYKEAILLQDQLEEQFHGNTEQVKERLHTYRMIEKAVPRKNLYNFLTNLLQKFPVQNNIRIFNTDKKEKKKKLKNTNVDTDMNL